MKKLLSIISLAFFLPVTAAALPVYADGCLPGEPCYTAPPSKGVMEPVVMEDVSKYYGTIGGGWIFMEKDEPILGHQIYEVKLGAYRMVDEDISLEASVGYMPNTRARQYPNPGEYRLSGDTWGMQYTVDALFHLNDSGEDYEPYLSFGGGLQNFDKSLEDGHTQAFLQGGFGAFLHMCETTFIKPDYRLMMVDSDTELNHKVTLSVGMFF